MTALWLRVASVSAPVTLQRDKHIQSSRGMSAARRDRQEQTHRLVVRSQSGEGDSELRGYEKIWSHEGW
jgi:hypothetical protein